jgi:MFS family permease
VIGEVYADVFFLVNFSMDFLCFYLCARLLHRPLSLWRGMLASALGGIYAVAALFLTLDRAPAFALDALVWVVLGAVADRSIYAAVIISFVGGVVGILVCWMCPYSELLIYAGALLFGLFFAACDVLGPTTGRYIFGPREFTHIYSRIVPIITIMAAIGVSGFATLSQLGWPIMFATGVATGTIGVVAGVLAIRFGKRLPQTVE